MALRPARPSAPVCQSSDVGRVDMEDASYDRDAPYEPQFADGSRDDDHRDRMVNILDLDAYLLQRPVHAYAME